MPVFLHGLAIYSTMWQDLHRSMRLQSMQGPLSAMTTFPQAGQYLMHDSFDMPVLIAEGWRESQRAAEPVVYMLAQSSQPRVASPKQLWPQQRMPTAGQQRLYKH